MVADDLTEKCEILYLITLGEVGGAQKHVFDLCAHCPDGFEIYVAMGRKGWLWDVLQDMGVSLFEIPFLERSINSLNDIKALRQITTIIDHLEPDLLCAHSSKAGILGRLAAYMRGVPAVFTAHGWAFTEGVPTIKRNIYTLLERKAAQWCDKIICVSEYDRQLGLRERIAGDNKLVTIYNGIPEADGLAAANPGKSDLVRIIMVGRFAEQKDYSILLRAVKQLEDITSLEVQLVGNGPLFTATQQLAEELELKAKVVFLGTRSDVPELLAGADIFVLTSNWEGFPITILEAMRAGLPVIASDVGGCGEAVVHGETGYLVPRNDLESLVLYLNRLISDADLRVVMGNKGRTRYLENFSVEQMVQKTFALYQSVLEGR